MVKERDYQDHSHNSINKICNFLVLLSFLYSSVTNTLRSEGYSVNTTAKKRAELKNKLNCNITSIHTVDISLLLHLLRQVYTLYVGMQGRSSLQAARISNSRSSANEAFKINCKRVT